MSADEFEEDTDLEIDEEDLDEDLAGDDLAADDLDEDVEADVLDDDLEIATEVPVPVVTDDIATTTAAATETAEDDDDDVLDLDEELHPDDVEAPLDTLLQERTASATLEDDEEEVEDDELDIDERGDGPTRIVPRRADEFLCKSCFLVLPRRRLADEERQFCDDCA
jgi:Domain of unknown function (DUF4193)